MEIPAEVDNYIKETIESSLGLPISEENAKLKIIALEDERHRLQNQVHYLVDRLRAADERTEKYKAESSMNAQGLKRCIADKERIFSDNVQLANVYANMKEELEIYKNNFTRLVDACDELERQKNLLLFIMNSSGKKKSSAKKDFGNEHPRYSYDPLHLNSPGSSGSLTPLHSPGSGGSLSPLHSPDSGGSLSPQHFNSPDN